MTRKDRDLLRSTFNEDAERYDRARPGYPPVLFGDLAELTSIGPGSRVLEIGPGTGQATRPLAERGCRVVAVELGADLAALAARNLAGFPSVEVVNAAFEDWPLPAEPFDLVLAATAFHWIDRPCGWTRSPTRSGRVASSRPSPPITSPVATRRSSPRSRTAMSAGTPTPRPL
jgi:protein-L-isoaspartate O-methyltransferase